MHFDGGALLKNSDKVKHWDSLSKTVNFRLPDIAFVVWIRLQNILSIKVGKEEILVDKITWGDKKVKGVWIKKIFKI